MWAIPERPAGLVRLTSTARAGRTLSYDDVTNYGKIVVALKETMRLVAETDEAIPPLAHRVGVGMGLEAASHYGGFTELVQGTEGHQGGQARMRNSAQQV